ncbi:hypothetical protein BDZ91DRAFT_792788 [Kalaharituber pfeilii]|nr:hypothetical protein BDZ91DRAFT_792788 [Kalaharituber pfeilii]
MHDHSSSHPLLIQVPLSVSPFVILPTAITLPYTYQTLPHALPPSSTAPPPPSPNSPAPPPTGYITSPSGTFSTSPEAIITSCQSLISHLATSKQGAEEKIREWEQSIAERELMEKRKIAPGYLDTGITILTPVKVGEAAAAAKKEEEGATTSRKEGEELDKLFGSLGM